MAWFLNIIEINMKFTVIKDTREQIGWFFEKSDSCNGTEILKLNSGDYTVKGYENQFTIERKGKLSEFVTNLTDPRFYRELERMSQMKHAFLLLEFNMEDVMSWPYGAGLPNERIKYIKTSPHFIIMKVNEIMVKYNVKVIFAGDNGRDIAYSLFKRIIDNA